MGDVVCVVLKLAVFLLLVDQLINHELLHFQNKNMKSRKSLSRERLKVRTSESA